MIFFLGIHLQTMLFLYSIYINLVLLHQFFKVMFISQLQSVYFGLGLMFC